MNDTERLGLIRTMHQTTSQPRPVAQAAQAALEQIRQRCPCIKTQEDQNILYAELVKIIDHERVIGYIRGFKSGCYAERKVVHHG